MSTQSPDLMALADYRDLPGDTRKHLAALEEYIGDTDGKECAIQTGQDTWIDDGVIDASDAVKAFNGLVAALRKAAAPEGQTAQVNLTPSEGIDEAADAIFELLPATPDQTTEGQP